MLFIYFIESLSHLTLIVCRVNLRFISECHLCLNVILCRKSFCHSVKIVRIKICSHKMWVVFKSRLNLNTVRYLNYVRIKIICISKLFVFEYRSY